jgi:peptidoglycan/xylan/chitin deacetylase (PgdA/CDA1 family)
MSDTPSPMAGGDLPPSLAGLRASDEGGRTRPRRRSWTRVFLATLIATPLLAFATHRVVSDVPVDTVSAGAAARQEPSPSRPIANDCSGGQVTFTFDDGPRQHAAALLDRLAALKLTAVFFWAGDNIVGREDVVRRALRGGNVLGNHTFDHPNLVTGVLPSGVRLDPWGPDQIREEFRRTSELLVDYGAPVPQYYRPPYGSIDAQADDVARQLGLRLVMSFGFDETDNIVDSHDSEGIPTEVIAANVIRRMKDGSIITMHDGLSTATLASIEALQPIVDAMNVEKLCATTNVRPDATGGALQQVPRSVPD